MVDILHKVGIKGASPDDVYKALTTPECLSAWWTADTQEESRVGGVILFRFGAGGFDMKVLELQPAKRVLWQVIDGTEEWIGTKIAFDLKQKDDWTITSSSLRTLPTPGAGDRYRPRSRSSGACRRACAWR